MGVIVSPSKRIVEWKFDALDTNGDDKISFKEVAALKRVVKEHVLPLQCSRQFPRFCDLDHDRKISRSEWSVCMEVDINMAFRLFLSLNKDRQRFVMRNDRSSKVEAPALDGLRAASLWASSSSADFVLKETPVFPQETSDDEKTDCKSQRLKAQEEHARNPNSGIYVPVCVTGNEKMFQNVQCHKLTGFCWCVEPETGKPITGTSARNRKPVCDGARKHQAKIRGSFELPFYNIH
ncbi:unnamed protein product [Soboliphyme baturini]|uniref:Thyroglobulin type-1 domain-containing protein n=1 Tax=Soboliphyme baturini TaxID=241478 RepID=A0A183IM28_9BILA|nr:unnamed protein product [Soboliphyme baturini]